MPSVDVYTKTGNKSSSKANLSSDIFSVNVDDHNVVKLAYESQRSDKRQNIALTKKRGEVRGGGRKPWRQKGTGRARVGSIRSPIWRGGGVVFGPDGQRNFSKKVNSKTRRTALKQALTLKNTSSSLVILDGFEAKGVVKPTLKLLEKITDGGKILLVVDQFDELIDRSTRNIANLYVTTVERLSVVVVMDADRIIITKQALAQLEERLKDKK